MALSYSSQQSVVSEHRRFVLWILNQRGKKEREWEEGVTKPGRFGELEKEDREEKYPQCFEVTLRLVVRHLRVGHLPSLKLASNLLSLRVGPSGIPGMTGCLSGIAYGPPLPSLFLNLSPFPTHKHTHIHTNTYLPPDFLLTALWQFPSLVLKRFEIAFGPEALAISN